MQKKRFLIDIGYRKEVIETLAKKFEWKLLFKDRELFIYESSTVEGSLDGKVTMKILAVKMNVFTTMKHPKQGTTTLERKNVPGDKLKQLFENPRKHTDLVTKHHKRIPLPNSKPRKQKHKKRKF